MFQASYSQPSLISEPPISTNVDRSHSRDRIQPAPADRIHPCNTTSADRVHPGSGERLQSSSGERIHPGSGDRLHHTSGERHHHGERVHPAGSERIQVSSGERLNSSIVGGGSGDRIVLGSRDKITPGNSMDGIVMGERRYAGGRRHSEVSIKHQQLERVEISSLKRDKMERNKKRVRSIFQQNYLKKK